MSGDFDPRSSTHMLTLQINIDEATMADVDESLSVLNQSRDEFFASAIERSAAKLKREAEVSRQYARAYGENPVGPEEFYVEEEQLIEAWKDIPWEPKDEAW